MAKKKDDIKRRTALDIGAEIIGAMDQEFHNAPDRVLAVVGAAYLDSLLEELFRAVFVEDKEEADRLLAPDRALGSNGSRYQPGQGDAMSPAAQPGTEADIGKHVAVGAW